MVAFKIDVSPLAVGIARAKTWVLDKERRKELRRLGKDIAADSVAAGDRRIPVAAFATAPATAADATSTGSRSAASTSPKTSRRSRRTPGS